ncbi:MAG: hypothetical protein V4638_07265 [Bacteroidota bacterium]
MKFFQLFSLLFFCSLAHSQELKLRYPKGHVYDVTESKISADGKHLLSSSPDDHVFLWEISSGKVIGGLKKASNQYNFNKYIEFSPDSNYYIALLNSDELIISSLTNNTLFSCQHYNQDSSYFYYINSAKFSPDGKFIVTTSSDSTICLWETSTGKKLSQLKSHTDEVNYAEFSPTGNYIASTAWDSTTIIYQYDELGNLSVRSKIAARSTVSFVSKFSPSGKYLLNIGADGSAYVSDPISGDLISSYKSPEIIQFELFSPDEKFICTSNGNKVDIWEVSSGKLLRQLSGHLAEVTHFAISKDQKHFATSSMDKTVQFWDEGGKSIKTITFQFGVRSIEFEEIKDNNGTIVHCFAVCYGNTIELFELNSGKLIKKFHGRTDSNWHLQKKNISNEDQLIVSGFNKKLFLLDNKSGKFKDSLQFNQTARIIEAISEDSLLIVDELGNIFTVDLTTHLKEQKFKIVASQYSDFTILGNNTLISPDEKKRCVNIYNYNAKNQSFKLRSVLKKTDVFSVQINQSGTQLVISPTDTTIVLYDISKKKVQKIWEQELDFKLYSGLSFNVSGTTIYAATRQNGILQIDVKTGKIKSLESENFVTKIIPISLKNSLLTMAGNFFDLWEIGVDTLIHRFQFDHDNDVSEVLYDEQEKLIYSTSIDGSIRLWSPSTGEQIIQQIQFDNDPNKWVHLHPSGLFDASPEAMEMMYWTKGLEVIEFNQLKARYWEPGLWSKVMKGEALRSVRDMQELKLHPLVEFGEYDEKTGKIPVILTKREGGFGKISFSINGKEVQADARGSNFDSSKEKQTILIDIANNPNLQDSLNSIVIKTSSEDGFIVGQGEEKLITLNLGRSAKPHFYAISIGTGLFSNPEINLKYPPIDAVSMSKAFQIGAQDLFGVEKTHIYTLTTDDSEKPTKEKIKGVFNEIAKTATSTDIFALYLSGHGITFGGEAGDFYYITTEASSANSEAYSDPTIRANYTISTAELTEWIKQIPANKQVMIIDACSSGKAVENLMASREIDASSLKAIDRMKDRTGMFVISGSAADAVSYEASRYGQGLLTYSILQAMKGAKLRDQKFFDADLIFNYARETVPELAKGIGGIQQPQLLMPKGGSFDFGRVNAESAKEIPLNAIKPVFVRSNLFNTIENDDDMQLSSLLDERLNEIANESAKAKLVFFDTREFPDSYKISGGYTVANGTFILKLKIKGQSIVTYDLKANSSKELIEQIIQKVESIN